RHTASWCVTRAGGPPRHDDRLVALHVGVDRGHHLPAYGVVELVEQPHPVLRRPGAVRDGAARDAVTAVDLDPAGLEEVAARGDELVALDLLLVSAGGGEQQDRGAE